MAYSKAFSYSVYNYMKVFLKGYIIPSSFHAFYWYTYCNCDESGGTGVGSVFLAILPCWIAALNSYLRDKNLHQVSWSYICIKNWFIHLLIKWKIRKIFILTRFLLKMSLWIFLTQNVPSAPAAVQTMLDRWTPI